MQTNKKYPQTGFLIRTNILSSLINTFRYSAKILNLLSLQKNTIWL